MNHSLGLCAVVLGTSIGCTGELASTAEETRMVDAGGHRLEMVFKGDGRPAVVFDAGMIGRMRNWTTVRDSVSLYTQTVIFERAGFGNSEEGPSPRTAEQLSTELHAALENSGLVFVDPATVAVYEYMRESDPERWDNYVDEVTTTMDPPPGWFGQWEALPLSLDQARQAWPLPDVPTVVLSALTAAGNGRSSPTKTWRCGSALNASSLRGFRERSTSSFRRRTT